LYLATTGVGIRHGHVMSMKNIQHGDAVIVSGPVGDHGIAVMLAREEFGLRGDIRSDAASVLKLTTAAMDFKGLRFMRDPTRGGIATVCSEMFRATGFGVRLLQEKLPVRDAVQSVCDMLGYDPMYLACEGRVVAVVAGEEAGALLAAWQNTEQGKDAAIIGNIDAHIGYVLMQTDIGGERILEELEDDPLPRIC
jgi:hydrogenase expression/formation protein HypE